MRLNNEERLVLRQQLRLVERETPACNDVEIVIFPGRRRWMAGLVAGLFFVTFTVSVLYGLYVVVQWWR